jgi:hypothetical protein
MIPKCDTSFPQTPLPMPEEKNETTSNTIHNLQSRLNNLHRLIKDPQIIHLHGFELLQLKSVSHNIKQRVNTLFFEAHIPCNWKINVKWSHPSRTKIIVHVTLLNYIVKERVKELLLDFFKNKYNNIIYVK